MAKAKDLVKKGSFLVAISIVIKFIGLVYRIPLTNMLGDTGNGYYGLAFLIYSYFIILASTGVSDTIARMISERVARKEYANARQVFIVGIYTSGILGLASCMILFFGSNFIAGTIYNTPQAAASVRSLAPAVLLVSLSSIFRGLYQGLTDVRPSAYADLLDQLFHAGFSILLVWMVVSSSDIALLSAAQADAIYSKASANAAMGSMYGAFGGFLFLVCIFFLFQRKSRIFHAPKEEITERKITIFKKYIWIVIPIMLSASVSNMRELIDTALFNGLMPLKGYTAEFINAQRGMMTGKYNVMINMPIAALGTLTMVLVPGIARAVTRDDYKSVQEHITTLMKLVMLVSMPAAVGLSALGEPIIRWLFAAAPEGGELLRYGAFIVIFFAVSQNASAILQGLGKIHQPVINAGKSACISIPALVVSILLLDLKIYSMIVGVTVFSIALAAFNMLSVVKYCKCKVNILNLVLPPAICAAVMGVFTYFSYLLLHMIVPSNTISIVGSIGVSAIVYFILILNTNWYTKAEIRDLPMGRILVKFRLRQ